MENELIFRILLGGLLGAFVASRAVQTHRRRPESERVEANLSADSSGALGNFFGATALLSTLVYLVSPQWMTWASISLPTPIRFIGILVALFGFGLMLWAQNSLGPIGVIPL